jgi:hypothetical protein
MRGMSTKFSVRRWLLETTGIRVVAPSSDHIYSPSAQVHKHCEDNSNLGQVYECPGPFKEREDSEEVYATPRGDEQRTNLSPGRRFQTPQRDLDTAQRDLILSKLPCWV